MKNCLFRDGKTKKIFYYGRSAPGSVNHQTTLMDYHGLSWTNIDYHGLSLTILDYLGFSWLLMDYPRQSWTIMDYHRRFI